MTKPPKRVKVILGPDKPTGDLKKWLKRQEKIRREVLKAFDREIAKQDAKNIEKAFNKKRKK